MARARHDLLPVEDLPSVAHSVSGQDWLWTCSGEPPLEELLNDPLMRLLWQADGLEPREARVAVRRLQVLIRRTLALPVARRMPRRRQRRLAA